MSTFVVTGATGFIGGHLARTLFLAGNSVIAICRDGDPPKGCETVRGDICDLRTCERAIAEYEPDGVFHLGAQALVGIGRRDPFGTLESNVRGTYNMLDAFRRHRKSDSVRMVVASSDKAYGELPRSARSYTEDMPLVGRGPYDVSKTCTDMIAQSYGETYSLPIAIIRAGNVYGPGDDEPSRIIPSLCNDFVERRPLTIASDGSPVREYLHVDDVVRGYISAYQMHTSPKSRAFNLGTGEPMSVTELVDEFILMLHGINRGVIHVPPDLRFEAGAYISSFSGKSIVRTLGTRSGEIQTQILDTTRAKTELQWQPIMPLRTALAETLLYAWDKYNG